MFDSLKQKLSSFIGGVNDKAEPRLSAVTAVKAAITGKAKLAEGDLEDMLWQLQTDLMDRHISRQQKGLCVRRHQKRREGGP